MIVLVKVLTIIARNNEKSAINDHKTNVNHSLEANEPSEKIGDGMQNTTSNEELITVVKANKHKLNSGGSGSSSTKSVININEGEKSYICEGVERKKHRLREYFIREAKTKAEVLSVVAQRDRREHKFGRKSI